MGPLCRGHLGVEKIKEGSKSTVLRQGDMLEFAFPAPSTTNNCRQDRVVPVVRAFELGPPQHLKSDL
ncbi:hypothetical protein EAI_14925 [Harpegnathos saltator]|uniref:Uncharacterized protein n=1 Tax=Harpegnathos saltator TaxID=610380 RepID=E2BWQ0_HARSA|nr:hypothetical protein EAI_14925 [Harpegnathos saltator]